MSIEFGRFLNFLRGENQAPEVKKESEGNVEAFYQEMTKLCGQAVEKHGKRSNGTYRLQPPPWINSVWRRIPYPVTPIEIILTGEPAHPIKIVIFDADVRKKRSLSCVESLILENGYAGIGRYYSHYGFNPENAEEKRPITPFEISTWEKRIKHAIALWQQP